MLRLLASSLDGFDVGTSIPRSDVGFSLYVPIKLTTSPRRGDCHTLGLFPVHESQSMEDALPTR
jgi:hypothetical protein